MCTNKDVKILRTHISFNYIQSVPISPWRHIHYPIEDWGHFYYYGKERLWQTSKKCHPLSFVVFATFTNCSCSTNDGNALLESFPIFPGFLLKIFWLLVSANCIGSLDLEDGKNNNLFHNRGCFMHRPKMIVWWPMLYSSQMILFLSLFLSIASSSEQIGSAFSAS